MLVCGRANFISFHSKLKKKRNDVVRFAAVSKQDKDVRGRFYVMYIDLLFFLYFFFIPGVEKNCKTVIFPPHQHPNAHMQILCKWYVNWWSSCKAALLFR